MCFVGWLEEKRIKEKRNVSSRYLPKYLSAVRNVIRCTDFVGEAGSPSSSVLGEAPPLRNVMSSYRNWERKRFPTHDVHVRICEVVVRGL